MVEVPFRDPRLYLLHLVRVLHDRGPSAPGDIYGAVADRAGVTTQQRSVQGSRGSANPVYSNRIQFARQALVEMGLIIGPADAAWRRGVWQLSASGDQLADGHRDDAALEEVLRAMTQERVRSRAQERRASRALAGLEEETPDEETDEEDEEVDEDIEDLADEVRALVDAANESAMSTMLQHVRNIDDVAFEKLVSDVLKSALRAESVRITPRSRDGGVDGIIYFDTLGIRVAVFEAKRYAEDNVVGRSLVDAFATAARRRRASHALFVTSSRFSKGAIEAAKDENIRLIDEFAFVELMARHGVGLRQREVFVLYEVEPAWAVTVEGDD